MRRVLPLLLFIALLLSGCGLRTVRTPPLPDSSADEARGLLPLGNCTVTADYAYTESFTKLVANSTWIVEGVVVEGMTSTRNLARSGNGPDPNHTVEGADTLTISLVRSHRLGSEGPACPDQEYSEPAAGSRWILFLRPSRDFTDLAGPAGIPWRYEVVDGHATPRPTMHPAFPAKPVDELISLIQNPPKE